ncbi:sulfurtransferase TusA family protein [uncultured Cohaesibacter sp.]|uniref:sulfurtransferase TusA family protein n=1 Tax=uncultured Cohaesibacter sp. TaxID=1002546 RepID=UPI0029C924B2|nr:sulfurtransferase TusA family protein [uncultured Cohaesibacter sp.]
MRDLDLTGLKCPLPVLHTQKALAQLEAGDRLRVTASDPMASIDIPHFCTQKGHRLMEQSQIDSSLIFIIEKGSRQA